MSNTHGTKWCHPPTRLAIYLRDGLACVWCEAGVESGVALTLDHLTPRSDGGTNRHTNLVTACLSCNSARRDTPATQWAEACGKDIRALRNRTRRQLKPFQEQARGLLRERGTVAGYLAARASQGE